MNKEFFKKILPYLAALAIFIILTLIYASPVLDGKVINAGDTKGWQGMRHETKIYNDEGQYSWWTGSMFSGMPAYQTGDVYFGLFYWILHFTQSFQSK